MAGTGVFLETPREINGDEGLGFYYRFHDRRVSSGTDVWGGPLGSSVEVYCEQYPVVRLTPKGAWIRTYDCYGRDRKFVLSAANKRFACPTEEQALESFIARKRRQIAILTTQRRGAEDAVRLAKARLSNHRKERDEAAS